MLWNNFLRLTEKQHAVVINKHKSNIYKSWQQKFQNHHNLYLVVVKCVLRRSRKKLSKSKRPEENTSTDLCLPWYTYFSLVLGSSVIFLCWRCLWVLHVVQGNFPVYCFKWKGTAAGTKKKKKKDSYPLHKLYKLHPELPDSILIFYLQYIKRYLCLLH